MSVDLNCDLGEGCANDAELMKYISSANIACGAHAGDRATMEETARLAIENNVTIGAHPGYRDKEDFGRVALKMSATEIFDLVTEQIAAMREICTALGVSMRHVKPHGALYNQAAKDSEIAAAIADAVRSLDDGLILYGLSGSLSIVEAKKAGLKTASEVFADRAYMPDGSLVPRSQAGAVLESTSRSISQVLQMVDRGEVTAIDSSVVPLRSETICIHGDGDHAVEFAKAIRQTLTEHGIEIRSP